MIPLLADLALAGATISSVEDERGSGAGDGSGYGDGEKRGGYTWTYMVQLYDRETDK